MSQESTGHKTGRKRRAVWLVALGGLAGILFAPASGHETRQAIAKDVKDGGRYLSSLMHDTRKELDHIAHKVSHL
jgi:gas vesicle protein